ncbi:hypothetical protein OGAPHI_000857 [Ogataea philodendri]|uniref:A-factor-processing enzyme n=1 Tax=Ogataea philodendri TaxID=1378263 RepID=A0A9P8T9S1_9ASCO|nr:uncharacterized protein OGAPHI_000857 [Ogataea philodendri]KAH3671146.1 hypothetical protein OGAPHI_000857 [Ogataea philodendri]
MSQFTVLSQNLEKPDIDDRQYRLLKLPNGLVSLVISDPTTDKSAAALDVNVGAFQDPETLPGLAHFCEHLLFMGTKKYPSENEYSSYLSKNSGFSNAFTSSEHTNYYFEVANEAMHGALDRFSQFFISPLFDPNCKDREINAVDSENKKNLQADIWRLHQLNKSLTNPNHPYHKFSTGNKTTLGDLPIKQGLDVREELLKFHAKYYSSNIMRLVIISNESLDTMTSWTVDMFSNIAQKDAKPPIETKSPYQAYEYNKYLIHAKPIMELRSLQVSFPIPDTRPYWESKPAQYLSHLIGHESEGSLLANFKQKGWATGLSCGHEPISAGYSSFIINVELTNDGLDHHTEVLEHVFKYIRMLNVQGPQEWIFQELRDKSITSFKFKQKRGASQTASRLAGSLHGLEYYNTKGQHPLEEMPVIPPRAQISPDQLLSTSVIRKYDPEAISYVLSFLNPENFRATLISQRDFSNGNVLTEKWYGTEYQPTKIDSKIIDSLHNIYKGSDYEEYRLPDRNIFIPTEFSLVEPPKDESSEIVYPKLIFNSPSSKVWFKINTKLGGPRSGVTLKFNLPGSTSTPLNSVFLSLFVEMLDDELNSVSYLASLGGLNHEFGLARSGMTLSISGFSHKLENLLDRVSDTLIKFTNDESMWNDYREERFKVIKEKMHRNLKNFGYTVPFRQIGPILSSLINDESWMIDEEIECFDAVTYSSFKSFVSNLFGICFVEMFVIGNYTRHEASHINELISSKLHQTIPYTESQFTRGRSLDLPYGQEFHFIKKNIDEDNINSCVETYIQLGEITDNRERVLTELVSQIVHEPFFDRLRTKEQLGYVVFSGVRQTRTTFGLRLLIQSERSTGYLLDRMARFLTRMGHSISTMTEEEFDKHVNAVINKKQQKVKNLSEEKARYWNSIASGYYDFDKRELDVETLKTIKLKEVVDFYNSRILDKDNHGKLVVHLESQVIPKQPLVQNLSSIISNLLFDYPEYDSSEVSSNELTSLVEKKITEETTVDEHVLDSLLDDEFTALVPNFKHKAQFITSILAELKKEHTIPNPITNVGQWKSQIPLTATPSTRIPEQFMDETLIEAKL